MRIGLIHGLKRVLGKNLISRFYNALGFLSDESYIRLIYRLRMGKKPDLDNPRTFTEKLQWLKLHDHNPEYTKMADKLAMRTYVKDRIGGGHTVPVLGIWKRFEDIDFESLPDRFVLKTTHDSGSYLICRDKASFDRKNASKVLSRSLKRNYYRTTREWQYKDIEPRIIAEQYMDDGKTNLTDYKFFCFNGKPLFMYSEEESSGNPTQAIADMQYNMMPFSMDDAKADVLPPKPELFGVMANISEKLSEEVPFLRVDMYCIGNTIYVGELTFYHYGGFIPFKPAEWDRKLGDMLVLPESDQ
jgi:hypothetical protein